MAILPATMCSFADIYGLSVILPLIPFHLEVDDGMGDVDTTWWTGAINSIQNLGVVLGCLIWGVASDRLGTLRALQLTMAGDVLLFALSSVIVSPMRESEPIVNVLPDPV